MKAVTDIVKELEEMGSPLANWSRATPFHLPEGYFASFPALVKNIVDEADPALDLPKEIPFALPEGYFESFSASILEKVTEPAFSKTAAPAFEIPAGYFENFAGNMLAVAKAADNPVSPVIVEENTSKTIAFRPQWKAMRWAAAAVLLLGIGIGSYKMTDFNTVSSAAPSVSAEKQLAMLDKNEISSYVQHNIDEFDMELLAEANVLNELEAKKDLRDLNKQDIEQYLDETGR